MLLRFYLVLPFSLKSLVQFLISQSDPVPQIMAVKGKNFSLNLHLSWRCIWWCSMDCDIYNLLCEEK